jgi:hypothetical protein
MARMPSITRETSWLPECPVVNSSLPAGRPLKKTRDGTKFVNAFTQAGQYGEALRPALRPRRPMTGCCKARRRQPKNGRVVCETMLAGISITAAVGSDLPRFLFDCGQKKPMLEDEKWSKYLDRSRARVIHRRRSV